MPDKLEALIHALEKVNDNPKNKILNAFISLLKELAADPEKKAQVNKDDNTLSGFILTTVAYAEEILNHPKIKDLIKLTRKLKPTHITNVLDSTWDKLDAVTKQANLHTTKAHKYMPKNRA